MKIKHLLPLAALLVAGNASAALYTLTTGSTATSNGISNSAGIAFQNSANAAYAGAGSVAFGIFSSTDEVLASAGSASSITSSFVQFGVGGAFTAPGLTGASGTFSRAENSAVGGTQFAGKNIYVLVGNNTTFASSTEFLILKTTFTFDAAQDAIPTPQTLTLNTTNASVIFGKTAADVKTTSADQSVTPGWSTLAVPEPSGLLLGLVGLAGLLKRRR